MHQNKYRAGNNPSPDKKTAEKAKEEEKPHSMTFGFIILIDKLLCCNST